MRVLSRPDNGEGWKQKFVCGQCRATLEATREDVRPSPGDYGNGPESFWASCPDCMADHQLRELPESVRRFARKGGG